MLVILSVALLGAIGMIVYAAYGMVTTSTGSRPQRKRPAPSVLEERDNTYGKEKLFLGNVQNHDQFLSVGRRTGNG